MDVVDGCLDFCRDIEVSVVAGAFLPETECGGSRSLMDGELVQQWAVTFLKSSFDFPGGGLFDVRQKLGQVYFRGQWGHEQVDVFGHEDVGYQAEGVTLIGSINCSCQIGEPEIVREQRLS